MLAAGWLSPTLFVAALALLVVGVIVARAGWLKIFGPVLFYEIVRSARQGRYFLLRALYATGLFCVLLWVRWLWGEEVGRQRTPRPDDLAQLASIFFWIYAVTQFVAVILLTPAFVAGCIADDKERRILDFLLATDLANREIIFGKLVARCGNLLLFLLAGLPVLSLIQFFGGIDPAILLLTAGATMMTMLGLVGVGIVNSVQRRRVRDAILATYMYALAYVATCNLAWLLTMIATHAPNEWLSTIWLWFEPAIEVFRWGDPIRGIVEVERVIDRPGNYGPQLFALLGQYAAFHGFIFIVGVAYAIWRLRTIALAQAGGGEPVKKPRFMKAKRRKPITERPMVWKEVYAEGPIKLGALARIVFSVLFAAGFIPVVLIIYFESGRNSGNIMAEINVWVRFANPVAGTLILLAIAVRAAGSVGGERDKDTLLSLMTTPLTARDILYGKFIGALAAPRRLYWWLAAIWFVGIIFGAVHYGALLLEAVALAPPAMASAALGLYFSTACRTTLRAIAATIGGMVFGLGGHYLFCGLCCLLPMVMGGSSSRDGIEILLSFEVGMIPPAVMAIVPVMPERDEFFRHMDLAYVVIGAIGNFCWLLVAAILWTKTHQRFSLMTNRAVMIPLMVTSEPPA